jgi:SAM-dependent methyltransferase
MSFLMKYWHLGTRTKVLPHDENSLAMAVAEFVRRDDIALLLPKGGVGVELGVAEGMFSEKILRRSELGHLYSVDMWAGDRSHDVDEYRRAIALLDKHRERNSILRMRFDEALDLFTDNYFDFIYVDGYAHTGQEAGSTLYEWYPKLKPGGIFAGDDYDPVHWPRVCSEVDHFAKVMGLNIHIIEVRADPDDAWSRFPTWLCRK